jgi:hypothetical protein
MTNVDLTNVQLEQNQYAYLFNGRSRQRLQISDPPASYSMLVWVHWRSRFPPEEFAGDNQDRGFGNVDVLDAIPLTGAF